MCLIKEKLPVERGGVSLVISPNFYLAEIIFLSKVRHFASMDYKIQLFKSVDTTEIMRSIIWILLVLRALSGFLFEFMTSNILYNPKK